MFDWNTELEEAKRRVAELEEMVFRLRDALRQSADNPIEAKPVERILERARRTLSVRMANLERARHHQRFIEHKIAAGTKVFKRLPYYELAETCFKAAKWMPQGQAAEAVRRTGAAFYTKAVALEKASPTDAEARAIFDDMAAAWQRPRTSE
jgi:hypothetical protein